MVAIVTIVFRFEAQFYEYLLNFSPFALYSEFLKPNFNFFTILFLTASIPLLMYSSHYLYSSIFTFIVLKI